MATNDDENKTEQASSAPATGACAITETSRKTADVKMKKTARKLTGKETVRCTGMVRMPGDDSGYTCDCGRYHKYPAYVYAHWSEQLTYTCDCGSKVSLQNGVATKRHSNEKLCNSPGENS